MPDVLLLCEYATLGGGERSMLASLDGIAKAGFTPSVAAPPEGSLAEALRSAGYDGWLMIESFGRALPDLAAATRVWRDLSTSPEGVYTEGLKLIKEQWQTAA